MLAQLSGFARGLAYYILLYSVWCLLRSMWSNMYNECASEWCMLSTLSLATVLDSATKFIWNMWVFVLSCRFAYACVWLCMLCTVQICTHNYDILWHAYDSWSFTQARCFLGKSVHRCSLLWKDTENNEVPLCLQCQELHRETAVFSTSPDALVWSGGLGWNSRLSLQAW